MSDEPRLESGELLSEALENGLYVGYGSENETMLMYAVKVGDEAAVDMLLPYGTHVRYNLLSDYRTFMERNGFPCPEEPVREPENLVAFLGRENVQAIIKAILDEPSDEDLVLSNIQSHIRQCKENFDAEVEYLELQDTWEFVVDLLQEKLPKIAARVRDYSIGMEERTALYAEQLEDFEQAIGERQSAIVYALHGIENQEEATERLKTALSQFEEFREAGSETITQAGTALEKYLRVRDIDEALMQLPKWISELDLSQVEKERLAKSLAGKLLDAGADVNVTSLVYEPVLYSACRKGLPGLANYLMESHPECIHARNHLGRTAIVYAAGDLIEDAKMLNIARLVEEPRDDGHTSADVFREHANRLSKQEIQLNVTRRAAAFRQTAGTLERFIRLGGNLDEERDERDALLSPRQNIENAMHEYGHFATVRKAMKPLLKAAGLPSKTKISRFDAELRQIHAQDDNTKRELEKALTRFPTTGEGNLER